MSISAKERREIPDSKMGVPGKDKYPLDSPEHIKSANMFINRSKYITPKEKKALADKIRNRAKEEGMDTSKLHAANKVAGVTEQVPPMSDGTSLGNAPPRLMAPYYDEQDELFSQLDKIDTRKFTLSPVEGMRIVSDIHKKVVADSKPPTGNQNCQLCTWCAEAQCRGMKVLPRPVYSPRDPALEIKGEMIVEHPYRNPVTSFENLMNIVSDENAVYGRFYVHVGWKGGTGGHEFMIVGLNTPFVMDAQQGYFESIANPKVLTDYFNDVDWSNSYICRLDDKPINSALLNSMNSMDKLVPWDPKLDIPYMKEHGMLGEDDMKEAEKRGWLTESFMDEYQRNVGDKFRRVMVPSDEGTEYLKRDPECSQYWEELNKSSRGEILVDKKTGEQIGHVFVHTNKKNKGFIFNLEVSPKYRRQGYGMILTDDAVHKFGGEDLTVDADNDAAINMYLKYGFEIYKKGQWHYDPPKDELWMKLKNDKRSEPIQEGAVQDLKNGVNPYSDKMVFHVTPEKHADGQVWNPRVPDYLDPYNPEEKGFEDNTTPRICFSTSIEGCLNGITVNLPRQNPDQFDKMYVYIPEKPWKEYKHKTNKELVKEKLVYDANVTREVWITEPVRMKLYGVIRVDQVSKVKRKSVVPTSKGEKGDRNYFTYKWHWVVKPKVLEKGTKYDYSQENVIADLCIDLKKFKYGLIKDGKLQTGNVSESDYEKYWVFHSGQEVDEAGGGNCWDMVEYESGYLDAFGVPYKKYFMNFTKTDGETPVNTHTFCVIPHNGKFIYIEQAFKRIIDEWGHERQKTFDSLKEIFQYVAGVSAEYDNQDLNYGVWDYTNAKIDYGTPADDFCNWIMTKCKMIYDGEAKKPTVKKEGYRVSRFGNIFQEADEKLSDTEDITIGDLNLDDDDDIGEDGPGLPGYIEDRMSEDDLKSYNASDDFEIPEEGDFDSYKVSDEKLEEARGPIEKPQPDEQISVTNVDLGMFGKDTSDVQNEYDPKETTILMKLMASEADAMNEYMDGAKETNVDVLRRLYADIANEERFHMEQLLYAKCELTGEKYVPKDPEVKSEYEELLKMGMDEETAMATAVDRCHIRGSIADDDTDERIEIQEDITQMESVLKMFDIIYDHTSMILESASATPDDVDHAMTVFTEACLMQEATYNATPAETAKSPLSKANKFGPLQLLCDTLRFLVRALMTIIRKFVEFLKRIRNRSRDIKRFVKQYGIKGIFSDKVRMYFVDLKQPDSMYINNDVWFLLSLAVDTTNACAMMLKRQPIGSFTDIPKNPKLDIRNNVARGMELLNGVQLIKSPMVVPDDVNEQQRIAAAFFGYTLDQSTNTKYYGDDGKSVNTLNTLKIICDRWVKFMQNVLSLTDSLSQLEQDKTSVFYTNKKQYDTAVKGLETVTKTCKAMISALQNDINVIIKLDNEAAEISIKKTEALDSIDIKSDKYIEGRANAYEQYKRTPETSRNAPVADRFKRK